MDTFIVGLETFLPARLCLVVDVAQMQVHWNSFWSLNDDSFQKNRPVKALLDSKIMVIFGFLAPQNGGLEVFLWPPLTKGAEIWSFFNLGHVGYYSGLKLRSGCPGRWEGMIILWTPFVFL